jgi:uncharacterized protein (TIGR02597 family)
MRRFLPCLSLVALLAFASFASAQSVTTDPVGFTTAACAANSDTLITTPFIRPPEFTGAIASVSGNVITLSGSPGWSANQFVYAAGTQPKTYFALVGPHASSNPNEGRTYTITANDATTLTVNLNGDDISGVQAQTQVVIIPYATINSVFPAADVNVSFVPSANPALRKTQIFIPNYAGNGTNLGAAFTYYYFNNAWRRVDRPSTEDRGDDPLVTAGYFTLRNSTTGTTLTSLGSVLMKKNTVPLITRTDKAQDNFVSLVRPVDVKLDDLGLISSSAFVASTSPALRKDQLFVYDNSQAALNKSASATYYYFSGHWRKVGDAVDPNTGQLPDRGTDTITTGSGFIVRKALNATGAVAYWQNSATY